MIPKFELQAVINKYYLNGMNEAVKWDIKDKNLNIKFTSLIRKYKGMQSDGGSWEWCRKLCAEIRALFHVKHLWTVFQC
jgi:hypothetical protein